MLTSFAGGRLFGVESGSPPPWLLALHGWGRSHRDFVGVVEPPSGAALDALAVDLPGFGSSPPPPASWGAEEYAECLDPVLEQMAERLVILGHSFGGRVAVALAAARPERVSALVLAAVPLLRPSGARPKPKLEYRLIRALAHHGVVGEHRLERAREKFGSEDYRRAKGVMRDVLVRSVAEEYRDTLAGLDCPVELVWGSDDTTVPLSVAEAALEFLKDGHLRVLEGVDHFVPTSAPQALRESIAAVHE